MTSQEARDLFSAAHDAQLEPEAQSAFEQALQRDAGLAAEFAEFRSLLLMAADAAHAAPVPDLLPGVQSRLRARSRGRFYRDRFSERAGLGAKSPVLIMLAIAFVAGLVWFGFSLVRSIDM